ncbi:MAG: hypothetical protein ACI8VW_003544, partial [bacterium]
KISAQDEERWLAHPALPRNTKKTNVYPPSSYSSLLNLPL